ncbi:MAG: sensor histidine kinase [Deltaproteobacteria bacterium]|nr:sensor histidine kinase [Deltaproteobacteria bacterium]
MSEPTLVVDGGSSEAVRIEVTNGGAIPPEILPLLFEPLRRGKIGGSPSGLGLGLYISQQIAVAHGGTLEVRSAMPDGTTRFIVVLPRQPI